MIQNCQFEFLNQVSCYYSIWLYCFVIVIFMAVKFLGEKHSILMNAYNKHAIQKYF